MKKLLHWLLLLVLVGTTVAQAQSVNYSCDFEGADDASEWVMLNGTNLKNKWCIGSAVNKTEGGSKALYVSKDDGASHTYNNSGSCFIAAYHEMTLDATSYDFSYDWMAKGEYSSSDYLRVALVPSSATITPGMSYPTNFGSASLPSGWIAMDDGRALYNVPSWQSKVGEVVVPTQGDYRLVVFWRNDYSGGYNPPAVIDNIVFSEQTCPKPKNLLVDNITATSAKLSWVESGSATSWTVEYGKAGFTKGQGIIKTVSNNANIVLTDLESNTPYDVYISSVCGAEKSREVEGSFRTDCGDLVLPLFEGFEGYKSNSFPFCWFRSSDKAVVKVDGYTHYSYSGEACLHLFKNTDLLSPKVLIPLNQTAISFVAQRGINTAGYLEVGVMTDTAAKDFTLVKTINPFDDEYHIYQVDFSGIDVASNGHIVIRQRGAENNYTGYYIDDIQIVQAGSCVAPSNIYITNVNDASATFHWSCANPSASIEFKWATNNKFSLATDDTIISNASSFVLNGLQHDKTYYVWVRSKCGSTDSSFWQEVMPFTTTPTCAQLASLVVDNITTNSAIVSWSFANTGHTPTNVILRYKSVDTTGWTSQALTTNSYILTGLTKNTKYNVEATILCGTYTSPKESIVFTTADDVVGEIASDCRSKQNNVPTSGKYKYSYTQTIYPGSAVLGMDTIRGIAYHLNSRYTQTRNISIYVANTAKSEFKNGLDYLPGDDFTIAYSGNFQFSSEGWDTITFTTPYANKGGNVVIAFVDETADYEYSRYIMFCSHSGSALYDQNNWDGSYNIMSFSESMNRSYLVPDIRFIGEISPITCKAPSVAFSDATNNSVSVSWIAGLDETAWVVDYRLAGTAEWTSFSTNTASTTATITGLNASSTYEVRVGSICTDDTLYGTVFCNTDCGLIDIPYFDAFASNQLQPCWHVGAINPTEKGVPSIENGKLLIPAYSYIILPKFDTVLSALQVRFKMDVLDVPLEVGVVSDPSNISSFELAETVFADPISIHADVISSLRHFEGNGEYIALRTKAFAVHIDSLYVEEVPACATPKHVKVANLGGTYLDIAWDTDIDATGWNVFCVPTGTSVESAPAIHVTTSKVHITGLTTSTTYDIYVAGDCSGKPSAKAVITATTMSCDPLSLPYITDFTSEAENAKWIKAGRGTNQWCIGSATSNNTPNALYISSDDGVNYKYNTSDGSLRFAYVPISIEHDGLYVLSYDWQCNGENKYDFGRVALVPANYNLEAAPDQRNAYWETLPKGWIAMDEGSLQLSKVWNSVMVADSINAGTYFLLFVWHNDNGSGSNPPCAIDNIEFRQITCPSPLNVKVSDITTNSAVLSWNGENAPAEGWKLVVNGEDTISLSTPTYTFTGLQMGTACQYELYAVCGADDWSLPVSDEFYTLCGDITTLPFIANFDNEKPLSSNSDPHCWDISTTSYPTVYQDGNLSSPVLKFYCYSSRWGTSYLENVASMPKIDEAIPMNTIEMELNVKASTGVQNILYVGVCTTSGDETTFTAVDTIDNFNGEWQSKLVSFENYEGNGRYITFYTEYGTYSSLNIYVDDIVLLKKSPCARPTNAYIDSYTHNSVTIDWEDNIPTNTYSIAISTENDVYSASRVINSIADAPYTIDALEGNTNYYVWLSAHCADCDTNSAWIPLGQFTTNASCGAVTGLKAIDVEATSATITWQAPTTGNEATSYIVSYKMNDNEPVVQTITNNYLFLTDLSTDSLYTVIVTTQCNSEVSANNSTTFTPVNAASCNTIGNGTTTTEDIPTNIYSKYSRSQIMFTANELKNMGDTVRGVTFFRSSAVSIIRDIDVYMVDTTLTDLTDGWLAPSQMTLVYSGTWNLTSKDCAIHFTTPFVRDHDQNLVLVVDDNTGKYKTTVNFYYTETDDFYAIYDNGDYGDVTENSDYLPSYDRPNVVFDATCASTTCQTPSVVVSSISDKQVSLVWNAPEVSSFKVEYRVKSAKDWVVFNANTDATTATITGLVPGTEYAVRVSSICNTELASRTISFFTNCGSMPLPFTEDFEDYANSTKVIPCWNFGGSLLPYVASLYNNGKLLRLKNNAYVALPQMEGNLNELQIHLRYRSNHDSIYALVGYMANPNQISSFVPVDTLRDFNNEIGYYQTVTFDALPAEAHGHIAIYVPHNYRESYIDDIVVEPIRTCAEPTNVVVSNPASHSVDLSWQGNASRYIIEYGEQDYRLDDISPVMRMAQGNTFTLDNLTPGTTYDVYVRAMCGNEMSYETNVVSFSTTCPIVTGLTAEDVTNHDVTLTWDDNDASSWNVYIFNNSDRQTQVVYNNRYEFNDLIGGTTYNVSVKSSCNTFQSNWCDTIQFTTPLSATTGVQVSNITNTGARIDWTLDTDPTSWEVCIYNASSRDTFSVTETHYQAALSEGTTYNVIVRAKSAEGIYSEWSEVETFTTTVAEVSELAVSAITTTHATFTWTAIEGQSAWEVHIYNGQFDQTYPVTEPTYTATSLTAGNTYQVAVRAKSAEGVTSQWCNAVQFMTVYEPVSNLAVADITTGSARISWNAPEYHSQWQIRIYNDAIDDTIAVLAQQYVALNLTEGTNYHVTVRAKNFMNTYSDWCEVVDFATLSTPVSEPAVSNIMPTSATLTWNAIDAQSAWQINLFNQASNLTLEADATTYQVADLTEGTTYQFAIRAKSADGLFSDWSDTIEFTTTCDLVSGLSISDATFTGATLSWNATATQTAWEVNISRADFNDTILVSNATYYTFSNLTEGAIYSVKVRAKSAENVYGEWSEAIQFNTLFPAVEGVVASNATSNAALIAWSANPLHSQWQVRYEHQDLSDTLLVSESQCELNGLRGGTLYQVSVRAISADGINSEWSEAISFTTINTPISHLVVDSVTATSARFHWYAIDEQNEWQVNLFNDDYNQTFTATERIYRATELNQGTAYSVAVRAVVNGVYSEWSDTLNFATVCPIVSDMTIAEITNNAVTVNWTATEGQTKWEVRVYEVAYPVIEFVQEVTTPTATIQGLSEGYEYAVTVRSLCTEGIYGDWNEPQTFTTLHCAPVEGIVASHIYATSAEIRWVSDVDQSLWNVVVVPQGESISGKPVSEVTIPVYLAEGLTPETAYDVYIKSVCSSELSSEWSIFTFTTKAEGVGIDGVEGAFNFTIYPNPASHATTISLEGVEGKVAIQVVDMNGRTITSESIECGVDCEKRIDISNLSQGTYFVRVMGNNINSVRKLIVR